MELVTLVECLFLEMLLFFNIQSSCDLCLSLET